MNNTTVVVPIQAAAEGGYDKEELARLALFMFIIKVLSGFVCVFGIIGNTLSFVILNRDRRKLSTTILLMSLAVFDTLFLFISIMTQVLVPVEPYSSWFMPYMVIYPYVIKYGWPMGMTVQCGTVWVIVVIAWDRYFAVVRPLKAPQICTTSRAKKNIAIVVFLALVYNIPRYFEFDIVQTVDMNNCTMTDFDFSPLHKNKYYDIIYRIGMYLVLVHTLPLLTVTTLNIRLIKAVRKSSRNHAELGRDKMSSQESHTTMILIVVITVFIICETPALVAQIVFTLMENLDLGGLYDYFFPVSNLLVMINSSVNFLIYCCFGKKFRQGVKLLFCKDLKDYERTPSSCRSADQRIHFSQR